MKKLLRILPLIAFVLGMTAALADHSTTPVVVTKEALDENNEWIDISGQVKDSHYICEEELNRECTRSFDAQGYPVPSMAEVGRYSPL